MGLRRVARGACVRSGSVMEAGREKRQGGFPAVVRLSCLCFLISVLSIDVQVRERPRPRSTC